ncbi:TerD family protein, partial [Hyella patelloides]
LEQCDSLVEDMLRYQKRWLRLGERIHPFEYKKRYPKCYQAFDILRNNKPVTTFNSRLETAFIEEKWQDALSLLQTRPGELARRLDFLLRNHEDRSIVIESFQTVTNQIATPVLLQLISHFEHRHQMDELRVFFPKGNVAKAFAIKNELPKIKKSVCQTVVQICEQALIDRFAQLPVLGKVYIDEQLHSFPVPFSQRSANKSLRQLTRGSRLPIPAGDTVRFFIWWKEGVINREPTGDVDLDLSAVMYDAEWNYLEHVSYTNLKSDKYQAVHSGDIISAPNGASEFIDLDIPSVLKYGGRYIVVSVLSFNEHPFCNIPECFAGWMIRQDAASGDIYEPQTVQDKVDLTANTAISIPAILDLGSREILWTDMSLSRQPSWCRGNNIENNQKGMVLIGKALTSLNKPKLDRLFKLHVQARGEEVSTPEAADTVFSVELGITPFEVDAIAAQFLV